MGTKSGAARVLAATVDVLGAAVAWVCGGCATLPSFPAAVAVHTHGDEVVHVFDTDGDGRPDYWQYQAPGGRKRAVAFADATGGPGPRIVLDELPAGECPHFLIALDGVPFELVEELYRAGHFRLFHPPARVVCCFPGMTDLALAELFQAGRCRGYEALYFDRRANRLSNANRTYLSGANSPWLEKMDYRCSLWWDVKVYLDPQAVFRHELDGMLRMFRRVEADVACAYSVGTAGLGTRGSRAAILDYLRTVDRLCEQIVHERRGRVKITLSADHGHNLVENRRISFDKLLKECGYRPARSLRRPRDVVPIEYGLVTYAALYTHDPAGVAECLLRHADVELACYREGGGVTVRDRAGLARIRKGVGGFIYDAGEGDPLRLAPILEELRAAGRVSPAGEVDGAALFAATVTHEYPDPLARIWEAFHDLADNPADVIVSLRDGACHGSRFFHAMVGTMASTHGSLNARNSTTFVLTMLGPLPPALRTREVLPALEELRAGR